MAKWNELSAEQLKYNCNISSFDFETTENLEPITDVVGQERAVKAVQFGLFNKSNGYNIYISGLVGTGKRTYAQKTVKLIAKKEAAPSDWCYVNNFDNPAQPLSIKLPCGTGQKFKTDIHELFLTLKHGVKKLFNSEDYEQAKNNLLRTIKEKKNEIINEFNEYSEENLILPQWTANGFVGIPLKNDKVMTPEEYQQLPKEDRERIDIALREVHEKSNDIMRKLQRLDRDGREELKKLDREVGLYAVGHFIEELKEKYSAYSDVIKYLEAVKQDVLKNINDFKAAPPEEENNPLAFYKAFSKDNNKNKYAVNLLVDNKDCEGAPVVYEINPTYYNLIGRVEYENRMGVVSTEYSMIKAGAIHRANGGYLILNARDLLTNFGAWEALKRVLKTKKILIENLGEQYGALAMASLKPQEIEVDIKVILIGNPYIYYMLYSYDEDFRKLFKIYADFDNKMENNEVNINKLIGFVTSTIQRKNLKHFSVDAVAKVIEFASRRAASQNKLTTQFNEIVELLCEADAWARLDNENLVNKKYIDKAIKEKRYRNNKYEEYYQEMFVEGKILIDTSSRKVGQVNGLAVIGAGQYSFGKPSRITANTFLGKSGIINIEREADMSGKTHNKGVLILSGYLGQKYAQERPLSITSSITFEQSYGGIDGDSASSTELYAIMSSIADIPLKQYIAVTGSVNQKGEIQPIGGVTEKVEGFFAVCKAQGLTGEQGVMIPKQNVNELSLDEEVITAVAKGKFHIYPVATIDEGIEILTDVVAGTLNAKGKYKKGTFHGAIVDKLDKYNEAIIKMAKEAKGKLKDKDHKEIKKTKKTEQ